MLALKRGVITSYVDYADGTMIEFQEGGGRFIRVVLRPHATISVGSDISKAYDLHREAQKNSYIANSVNFSIRIEASISVDENANLPVAKVQGWRTHGGDGHAIRPT